MLPVALLTGHLSAGSPSTLPLVPTVDWPDGAWYLGVVRTADSLPGLAGVAAAFTQLGLVLLAGLLVASWWTARRGPARARAAALASPVAVGAAAAATLVVKWIFAEPRPCRVWPVHTLVACPTAGDFSFPSNHSAIAAALVVAVWAVDRRLGLVAVPLAVLEGVSRVWVGVHYPHDVLVGWMLGAVTAVLVMRVGARVLPGLLARRSAAPAGRAS